LLELRGRAVGHDTATGSLRLTGMVAYRDGRIAPVSMTAKIDAVLAGIRGHTGREPVVIPLRSGVARVTSLVTEQGTWVQRAV
jgi:hypothetical protein